MSDHLPECDLSDPICTGNIGGHIPRWMVGQTCVACKKPCICDRLRACEQRVRNDLSSTTAVNPRDSAVWKEGGPASKEYGALTRKERQYRLILDTNREYDEGYEQGVNDERARIRAGMEALVRFDHNGYALVVYPDGDFLDRAEVLAVIDGEDR